MTTEQRVAAPATIREFTKYLASGTVDQMSMYGRTVSPLGSQRNLPVTSASGFSELETITYTGTRTKPVSRVRKIRRDHRNERGAAIVELVSDIGGPPSARGEQEVRARHDQQEEQQQDGHGGAG